MAPATLQQAGHRRLVLVGLLACLAALSAVAGSLLVFDDFTPNNDEPVYVYQSETFQAGRLTVPAGDHDPWFLPWLHAERDGRLFSVFQPVWPAEMALARALTGTERTALALNAAAAVLLLYAFCRELLHRRGTPVLAAALLVASPFFLVQSATRLSYTLALVLALAFGWCLLRAGRTGSLRWYAAAGFAWAVLAVDRPLDALLLGSMGLVHLVVTARRAGRLWPALGVAAAGAAPILALGGAYNTALTGAPWTFALQAAGGNNDFGFGTRQLTPSAPPVLFELRDAWQALLLNLGELPRWSAGGLVVVPLVVLGFVVLLRQRRWVAAAALGLVTVLIPFANLFYWGNVLIVSGRHILGPHYYLDLLVPVVVLSAVAVAELSRWRPALGIGVVLVMVVATGVELRPKLEINREIACTNGHVREEVEAAGAREAIVLLPSGPADDRVMHPIPTLRNPPDLDADVLYARNLGPDTLELAERSQDRQLLRISMRIPADGAVLRRVPVVDELELERSRMVRVPFRVVNRTGARVVTAYVADGPRYVQYLLDDASRRGETYRGTWIIGPDGIRLADSSASLVASEFPWRRGTGTLAIGTAAGRDTDLLRAELHEQRVWYRARPTRATLLVPGESWHRTATPTALWYPEDVTPALRFTGSAEARRHPRADPCASYGVRFRPPDELLSPAEEALPQR